MVKELGAESKLIFDILQLERKAYSLGMLVTAHTLNRARNAAGWEILGDVVQAGKASRDEREEDRIGGHGRN